MANYEGIKFSYAEMLNEIRRMQSLAAEFLSQECEGVLQACATTLENIRNASNDAIQYFEISECWPIRTIESHGEYRASGKKGGTPVYGTLFFRWGIRNPNRGIRRQTEFHLVEEATISIQIFDADDDQRIARWQIEAGDAHSPGCHFHAAVNQYGDEGRFFPEWLKVPRFPSILLTPMDGVEFLLGELFQLRWHQSVSMESDDRNSWAKSQGHRLTRILEWKLKTIRQAETTPWMAIKKAKPELWLLAE